MESLLKVVAWLSGLPAPAKSVASVILVLVTGLLLWGLWAPGGAHSDAKWPDVKTMDTLTRALRDESETNAKFLLIVLNSGDRGIYPLGVSEQLKLARGEVVTRGKELAERHFLEIRGLTDFNYRISNDVWSVVGAGGTDTLRRLLK